MDDILKYYLDAAVDMGFDGTAVIENDVLYLCGDACRMLIEDLDNSGPSEAYEDDDGTVWNMFPVGNVSWCPIDLEEPVPAKMVITATESFYVMGPVGAGMPDGSYDDLLMDEVRLGGVDDFRQLFPLVVDVLAGNLSGEELEARTSMLSDRLRDLHYSRQGIESVGDGTGR